jgi:acyl-coenzyme A thioesterase PaaI-like protein
MQRVAPPTPKQGFLRSIRLGPGLLKWGISLWPPFLGAGIRVQYIAPDFSEIVVALKMGLFNRNYVGTHFGGSLFSMTDPFFMLMLMHRLGKGYVVWDRAAKIDFLHPAKGTVTARFTLDEAQIEAVRAATADGEKHLPTYTVDVVNADGEVCARVEKTVYIRKLTPKPAG